MGGGPALKLPLSPRQFVYVFGLGKHQTRRLPAAFILGNDLRSKKLDDSPDLDGMQDHHHRREGAVDHVDDEQIGKIPDEGLPNDLPKHGRGEPAQHGVAPEKRSHEHDHIERNQRQHGVSESG